MRVSILITAKELAALEAALRQRVSFHAAVEVGPSWVELVAARVWGAAQREADKRRKRERGKP